MAKQRIELYLSTPEFEALCTESHRLDLSRSAVARIIFRRGVALSSDTPLVHTAPSHVAKAQRRAEYALRYGADYTGPLPHDYDDVMGE